MREVFVWAGPGKVVPKEEARRKEGGPYYVPDEAPFVSPIDFKTVIDGRKARTELEKRHGITQVGTDQPKAKPKEKYVPPDYVKTWWGD